MQSISVFQNGNPQVSLSSKLDLLAAVSYADSVGDGIIIVQNKRIVRTNGKIQSLLGERDTWEFMDCCELAAALHLESCPIELLSVGSDFSDFCARGVTPLGLVVDVGAFKVYSNELCSAQVFILRDVTDHVRVLKAVAESEKLKMVGEMAAGIVHDLNNPLTVILAGMELLLRQESFTDDGKATGYGILTHASRMRALCQTILALSRPNSGVKTRCDINALIHGVAAVRRSIWKTSEIIADLSLAEDLPQIVARPQELIQVLMNLLSNAEYALSLSPGPHNLCIDTFYSSGNVSIAVSDNGPGVPDGLQNRIFDSFVTTKPVGEGTGLGLSISRKIIETHDGSIVCENIPGSGARFTITLPTSL